MSFSGVVDIIIVLVAVYLALSVLVSQVQEGVATLIGLRQKNLYNGIFQLLGESVTFTDAIMTHPLVTASQGATQKRPPYVDARNFSTALWQAIAVSRPAGDKSIDAVAVDLAQVVAAPTMLTADLKTATSNLPNSKLKTQLCALLNTGGSDYNDLLQVTDAWFNRQMDRVSGWYRRQSQAIVLVISALLVFFLGVDTVRISTWLASDQTLRTSITNQIVSTLPSPSPSQTTPQPPSEDANRKFLSGLDNASFLQVFLGPPWGTSWTWRHAFGLIVTFLAVTLGAPFWFDVLMKISNMRLTGPKPDT